MKYFQIDLAVKKHISWACMIDCEWIHIAQWDVARSKKSSKFHPQAKNVVVWQFRWRQSWLGYVAGCSKKPQKSFPLTSRCLWRQCLVMWQACSNSGQTFLATTAGDHKKQPRFCILISFSGIRYLLWEGRVERLVCFCKDNIGRPIWPLMIKWCQPPKVQVF